MLEKQNDGDPRRTGRGFVTSARWVVFLCLAAACASISQAHASTVLYLGSIDSVSGAEQLNTYNLSTSTLTNILASNFWEYAFLAKSPAGVIYGASGGSLYQINPTTGVATYVSSAHVGGTSISDCTGFTFSPAGTMYYHEYSSRTGTWKHFLYSGDVLTGSLTLIGQITGLTLSLYGIEYANGTIYGTYDNQIYNISPTTAVATLIGGTGNHSWDLDYGADGVMRGSTVFYGQHSLASINLSTGAQTVITNLPTIETWGIVSTSTGGSPPAAPSNPGATNIGATSLTWTWQDNSSDETGFKVYADPGAGPPTTLRATTAANATSWSYTGLTPISLYSFQVVATNANGDSSKTTNFTDWTVGGSAGVSGFVWAPVPSPQTVNEPFGVTVTAVDSLSQPVTTFNGTVNLSGSIPGSPDVTIGTGTTTANWPMGTFYHDERTQVIYLASEMGGARSISSLSLYVGTVPGQVMNYWTIRMKHTAMSAFGSASWDGTGWITTYQANQTVSSTGWVTFPFTTPFPYNGTDNLLVDFSFNNSSYTTNGVCRYSIPGGNRVLYFQTDSGFGDPLTWSGTSPAGTLSTYVPNIKLGGTSGTPVSISPTVSANFVDGVWSGSVTVLQTAAGMLLTANDGAGHSGNCNTFDATLTIAAPVMDPEPGFTPGTTNTVSWAAVPGAQSYQVQVDDDPLFGSPNAASPWISSVSYPFSGLTNGLTYYYRVKARDLAGLTTASWQQTSQVEFDAGIETNVSTSGVPGDVTLAWGAGSSNAIQNPSFEIVSGYIIEQPTYWTTIYQGSNLTAEANDIPYGNLPTDGTYYVYLYTDNNYAVSTGDYAGYSQAIDFTGASQLRFAYSRTDMGGPHTEARMYIDSNLVWSKASGWNATESVDVSSYTGLHTLKIMIYVVSGGTFSSEHAYFDDFHLIGTSGYVSAGSLVSPPINPSGLQGWNTVQFTKSTPVGTSLTVDVLPAVGSTAIPGFANISNGADISSITDTTIRLRANLATTNTSVTPALHDWGVTWLAEPTGSAIESDWSAPVASTQDATAPSLVIGPPVPGTLNTNGPVSFTVSYTGASEITLEPSNVSIVDVTGMVSVGTKAVSGSGLETRTITLNNVVGYGTFRILIDEGSASDEAGNLAYATGPSDPPVVVQNVEMPVAAGPLIAALMVLFMMAGKRCLGRRRNMIH